MIREHGYLFVIPLLIVLWTIKMSYSVKARAWLPLVGVTMFLIFGAFFQLGAMYLPIFMMSGPLAK